jgi:hypothetical protein
MNITTHEENTCTTKHTCTKAGTKAGTSPSLEKTATPQQHAKTLETPHKIRQRKAESAKRSARS